MIFIIRFENQNGFVDCHNSLIDKIKLSWGIAQEDEFIDLFSEIETIISL